MTHCEDPQEGGFAGILQSDDGHIYLGGEEEAEQPLIKLFEEVDHDDTEIGEARWPLVS